MTFGETLKALRKKAGKSRYQLAQFTGIDQAYILRLERGEKSNPSRDVVLMLGLALVQNTAAIGLHEVAYLLESAGHLSFRRRGEFVPAA